MMGTQQKRLLNLTLLGNVENRIVENTGAVLNACLDLSGGVGEFNDMIKKWIFHEKDLDETHLKKEMGDIM